MYDTLQIAIKRIETHAPYTEAMINSISKGSHTIKHAKQCMHPGIVHFSQN